MTTMTAATRAIATMTTRAIATTTTRVIVTTTTRAIATTTTTAHPREANPATASAQPNPGGESMGRRRVNDDEEQEGR